jgi:hypothetical protein
MPKGIATTSVHASGSTLCYSRWLPRSTPAFSHEALETWRVTLLSTPAVVVRIDANDDAFAEANSLLQEAASFRRAVEHKSRNWFTTSGA